MALRCVRDALGVLVSSVYLTLLFLLLFARVRPLVTSLDCSPDVSCSWQSTWLFPTNEGPRCTFPPSTFPTRTPALLPTSTDSVSRSADYKATSVLISMTLVVALFAFLNLLYLRRENAKKAELREANGGEVDAESWREKGDRHEHFVYSM